MIMRQDMNLSILFLTPALFIGSSDTFAQEPAPEAQDCSIINATSWQADKTAKKIFRVCASGGKEAISCAQLERDAFNISGRIKRIKKDLEENRPFVWLFHYDGPHNFIVGAHPFTNSAARNHLSIMEKAMESIMVTYKNMGPHAATHFGCPAIS